VPAVPAVPPGLLPAAPLPAVPPFELPAVDLPAVPAFALPAVLLPPMPPDDEPAAVSPTASSSSSQLRAAKQETEHVSNKASGFFDRIKGPLILRRCC
jgi:hypothetical protein